MASNDVTLEAKTGEEVFVNKGSFVNVLIGAYHRDPEFFPDPDTYNPDRFDDESQQRNILGFGDGPRKCPGWSQVLTISFVFSDLKKCLFRALLTPYTSYIPPTVSKPSGAV